MVMKVEHRINIDAPPDRIFRLYEDVANWHTWDPDTKCACLDGPLRIGAKGRLAPTKGRAVPMYVTAVDVNRHFTVESRIPLLRMLFEHELVPAGPTTEVVHRVTIGGMLSLLIGPALARRLNEGLPVTLSNLKRRVEAGLGQA
jgi:hypothetical protein